MAQWRPTFGDLYIRRFKIEAALYKEALDWEAAVLYTMPCFRPPVGLFFSLGPSATMLTTCSNTPHPKISYNILSKVLYFTRGAHHKHTLTQVSCMRVCKSPCDTAPLNTPPLGPAIPLPWPSIGPYTPSLSRLGLGAKSQ